MADEETVIEVALEPDKAPGAQASAVPTPPAGEPAPASDPVEELKRRFEETQAATAAREAAAEAEARRLRNEAEAARQDAAKARQELGESNVSAIDSAIAAAQAEADNYQRAQEEAFKAGEFAKAAEAGRKMARAEATITRLEEGKADLEARKSAPVEARQVEAEPAKKADDPFEAAIATSTPRAQKWLREHRDYVTDPKKNNLVNAAHYKAVAEGHVVDSDAYYEFCEKELGLKTDPTPPARQDAAASRATAMPSAPVSRDLTPSGGNPGGTRVVLSPGERANATDGTIVWNYDDPKGAFKKGDPIGVQEFARRKAMMQKEGNWYDRKAQ